MAGVHLGASQAGGDLWDGWVDRLRGLVAGSSDPGRQAAEVEALLPPLCERLAYSGWRPGGDGAVGEHYARHSLYVDPANHFEIVALVWCPGQHTPLHDHDETWGVEAVLAGQLYVANYERVDEVDATHVRLQPLSADVAGAGGTSRLLPPADCHRLICVGREPAITIHVYGKQLTAFRRFDAPDANQVFSVRPCHVGYTSAPTG